MICGMRARKEEHILFFCGGNQDHAEQSQLPLVDNSLGRKAASYKVDTGVGWGGIKMTISINQLIY